MSKRCGLQHLGLVPYQQAWDYQHDLAEKIAQGERDEALLLLEHTHTYTLGRRGQSENLLWSEAVLTQKGIDVLWVDRGGDITYHGPGQIVGYPLLRLAPIGWEGDRLPEVDYVGYIRKLELVLIRALAEFGLEAFRVAGKTGVWVQEPTNESRPRKIASIGVKVDARGISRHGFALNVNPDMAYWEGIVPCGLDQVEMTSLALIKNDQIQKGAVLSSIERSFETVFDRILVPEQSNWIR